jgi:hypothetical protein
VALAKAVWDTGGMFMHLRIQDNRREWYMVIGLVFTALMFSHAIFGWPGGPPQLDSAIPPDPTRQSGDGDVLGQIPWVRLIEGLPLLAVGILYFLGRRHRNSVSAVNDSETVKDLRQQVKGWTNKWEDERSGASARDQIIEQLRKDLSEAERRLTKAPENTLTIHSAEWIPIQRGSSRQVERFIQKQVKEAIVDSVSFRLDNSSLGGELPGAKDTHKFLKFSYSYGSNAPREIVKDEYDWLILPEPPFVEAEEKSAKRYTWPWDVFTVQEKYADLSSDPNVSHKDKVRLVLTNATGKELNIWTPIWESAEVHAQHPFGSRLHKYGPAGWKVKGSWDEGHSCITLAAGESFMCWIGLLEPSGEGIIQRLKKESTGTAIFPVKIEGKLYHVPVNL